MILKTSPLPGFPRYHQPHFFHGFFSLEVCDNGPHSAAMFRGGATLLVFTVIILTTEKPNLTHWDS